MKKVLFAISFTALFSAPVFACSAPENKPEIPDPATSATAQMVKANNQVREYVAAMEAYIDCSRMSSNQQRRAVNELEEFAESFNKAVREFRLASN